MQLTFRPFYPIFFLIVFICPMWIMAQRGPQFEEYHRPDEIVPLLTSWSSQYPELAQPITIGKSAGGQDLVVLRIAAQPEGSGDPDWRPAVFVSANVEGVHLIGTEAALMLIETLLERYGSDEKVTSLMEKRIVYVATLLNPDGALSCFENPRYERSTKSTSVDDDLFFTLVKTLIRLLKNCLHLKHLCCTLRTIIVRKDINRIIEHESYKS